MFKCCLCKNDKYPGQKVTPLKSKKEKYCSICREKGKNFFCTTECNHIFHLNCLNTWLKKSENCPYCRTQAYTRRGKCRSCKDEMGGIYFCQKCKNKYCLSCLVYNSYRCCFCQSSK